MMASETCWRCGATGEEADITHVHDLEQDISVPICLDCRTGWTDTLLAARAFSESWRQTIDLLTGRAD